jgi:hypothetical protein
MVLATITAIMVMLALTKQMTKRRRARKKMRQPKLRNLLLKLTIKLKMVKHNLLRRLQLQASKVVKIITMKEKRSRRGHSPQKNLRTETNRYHSCSI